MKGLAIKEVAERTGIAAATIRMWEQRYGFPEPARTSSGYRLYTDEDVECCAASARCATAACPCPRRSSGRAPRPAPRDRPSIFGAIAGGDEPVPARRLRKATLLAHLARDRGRDAGARRRRRWSSAPSSACATSGRSSTATGGWPRTPTRASCSPTSTRVRERAGPPDRGADRPARTRSATSGRWSIDAPGYAACLLAWETPESQRDDHLPDRERRFEALWTLDPRVVRRAALVGAALAARAGAGAGRAARGRCCATGRWRSRRRRRR